MERTQNLLRRCGRADPGNETACIHVLDDLDDCPFQAHFVSSGVNDRDTVGGQGGKPAADPTAVAICSAVVSLPIASVAPPLVCQCIDDQRMSRGLPALTALQPSAPRSGLASRVGAGRWLSSVGVGDRPKISTLATQRSATGSVMARISTTRGHSRTSRRSCQTSTHVTQSSASGAVASRTAVSSCEARCTKIPQNERTTPRLRLQLRSPRTDI